MLYLELYECDVKAILSLLGKGKKIPAIKTLRKGYSWLGADGVGRFRYNPSLRESKSIVDKIDNLLRDDSNPLWFDCAPDINGMPARLRIRVELVMSSMF